MDRKTRPGWKSGKGAPNDNNDTLPLTTRREWKHEIPTDSHHLTTKNDNHNTSTTIAINNNQPYVKKYSICRSLNVLLVGLFLGAARQSGWNLFLGDIFYTTLAFEWGFRRQKWEVFCVVECVYFFVVVSWEWSGELLPWVGHQEIEWLVAQVWNGQKCIAKLQVLRFFYFFWRCNVTNMYDGFIEEKACYFYSIVFLNVWVVSMYVWVANEFVC